MSEYKLAKHPEYGYLRVEPTPTKEEIAKFYADEFYASEPVGQVNDSSLEIQNRDREFYTAWREDLAAWIENTIKKDTIAIYDFGCGWCETLNFFKNKGYECYGIDTAPGAIEHGKTLGLNVEISDLEDINPFHRKFDVVLMQNVLEHLAKPEDTIKKLHSEVLEDCGLLIIDVPNEFNDFQVAGKELHNLDEWWVAPPAHLNYFTVDSLRQLLEQCEYKVLDEVASFPLEMFLLMDDCYVGNPELGRQCHEKRMAFEKNLTAMAGREKLHGFYRALAQLNLGRQILTVSQKVG